MSSLALLFHPRALARRLLILPPAHTLWPSRTQSLCNDGHKKHDGEEILKNSERENSDLGKLQDDGATCGEGRYDKGQGSRTIINVEDCEEKIFSWHNEKARPEMDKTYDDIWDDEHNNSKILNSRSSKERLDSGENTLQILDILRDNEERTNFSGSDKEILDLGQNNDDYMNIVQNGKEGLGFEQHNEEILGFDQSDQETLSIEYIPMEDLLGFSPDVGDGDDHGVCPDGCNTRREFYESIRLQADKIFRIILQDGPGFNCRLALDELQLSVSSSLVREVLLRILWSVDGANRSRCAKLAYKFFVWSGQQMHYKHNSNVYNLMMNVFAKTEELKAMWRLVDEMTEKGLSITARTFNILICTCGVAGMARGVVERFLKSKSFNYRPFKHSFNAILHSLLCVKQYRLVEWVHQKMLHEGFAPDVLTYNMVLRAKYMMGKLDEFHRLLDEMGKNGFAPDLHTYNLLLHVLGNGDKPLAAVNLLNYMDDIGCHPSVLHFTTLIDGLSRAGNIDACEYFYDEMIKKGCQPDTVCYTVMIMGLVVAGEFSKAQDLFDDMIKKGQLPNAFTYGAMIRGLCIDGNYDEACSILKSMESKGCTPNFSVYSNLVRRLRNAGKVSQADDIISYMVEKGHYLHFLSRFKGYRTAKYDFRNHHHHA